VCGDPLNKRYSKIEYANLLIEFVPILKKISARYSYQNPLSSKEDFGDIDILIIPIENLSVETLKYEFNTEYVSKNGTTWSLLYKDFQVDLITTNDKEFEFSKAYFCRPADYSNFVGKVAHQLGLKFGHNGLWLPIRFNDSHKLSDILLTLDPRVAEDFLDIKPLVNATKIEDVFENIVASKYFNPEVFQLENNNQTARVRDKKRPSYRAFLEYMKSLPDREYFPRTKDKTQHLPIIFEEFPEAEQKYKDLYAYKNLVDSNREKFNGDLVSVWTKKTRKELGNLMVELKKFLTHEKVSEMSAHDVKLFVLSYNS